MGIVLDIILDGGECFSMRIIRVVRRFGEKVEESKVHYANARAACYRYAIDLEFPIRCVSNRVIIADRYVRLAAH